MGAFLYGPAANDHAWILATDHSYLFPEMDFLLSYSKWRLALHLDATSANTLQVCWSAADGLSTQCIASTVPTDLRSGWIHTAVTYEPNSNGGTLTVYMNGALIYAASNTTIIAGGSNGAYVYKQCILNNYFILQGLITLGLEKLVAKLLIDFIIFNFINMTIQLASIIIIHSKLIFIICKVQLKSIMTSSI